MNAPKGPKWDDIHTGSNRVESRECGGYLARREEMGKTRPDQ